MSTFDRSYFMAEGKQEISTKGNLYEIVMAKKTKEQVMHERGGE